MKNIIVNVGYFIKEAFTVLRTNRLSNFLSFISIGLAFFLLSLVISAWVVSLQVIDLLQQEAEMSVFVSESANQTVRERLSEEITVIPGVLGTRVVDEAEALERMEAILGEEAEVLGFFDENPFEAFIEVQVDLSLTESIAEALAEIPGIRYVRDNREVLNQIRNIAGIQRFLGFLFVIAAGAATLVVISHIIRQGIYHNREQINTLRLLGAPEAFIALPFLLVGLSLTVGGGILASLLTGLAVTQGYAQLSTPLPFIPLPPREVLIRDTSFMIITLSVLLGIGGSFMGLKTSKET